eukprot:TRINITY_DN9297_c0_g1_i1.p1 TRINITY_DN9297_c0_g1~~TRINITY_DN9297_c0_g1_i1.p1  ORF type:complete len:183 (+),score=95.06 TRINITY_DN9297_c0_g1_i1:182-730(+)
MSAVAPFYALPKLVGGKDVRREVLKLYKKSMRATPTVVKGFGMAKTVRQVKDIIHEDFKNKATLTRLEQTEMLLMKGYQDMEELLEGWKTKYHVDRFFDEMETNSKKLRQKRDVIHLDKNTPREILGQYVAFYADKPFEEGTLDFISSQTEEEIEKRFTELFESREDAILNDFMDGHANEDD